MSRNSTNHAVRFRTPGGRVRGCCRWGVSSVAGRGASSAAGPGHFRPRSGRVAFPVCIFVRTWNANRPYSAFSVASPLVFADSQRKVPGPATHTPRTGDANAPDLSTPESPCLTKRRPPGGTQSAPRSRFRYVAGCQRHSQSPSGRYSGRTLHKQLKINQLAKTL